MDKSMRASPQSCECNVNNVLKDKSLEGVSCKLSLPLGEPHNVMNVYKKIILEAIGTSPKVTWMEQHMYTITASMHWWLFMLNIYICYEIEWNSTYVYFYS
jgi:hypothetical protein